MARLVSLNVRATGIFIALGGWALAFAMANSLQAQGTAQQQAAAAAKPVPAVKGPVNSAPPMPSPDVLGRFGKIVAPGDVSYPIKLKLPFPDVGEVKVPTQDEWTMRDKLEKLSELSDVQIRAQLQQWPAYNKMSLRDEGQMLQRLQDFRDYHQRVAMQKAHDMGLLTMTPADMARFEKQYWDKRLQMDHDLIQKMTPIYQAEKQKMDDALFREFSSVAAQAVPPAPRPAAPKPGATLNKPAPGAPTTDVAQAPR